MRKILLILFSLFLTGGWAWGQGKTGTVKGRVADSTGKAMDGVTVTILYAKDSLIADGRMTNSSGQFEISAIESGDYLLYISSIGYAPVYKKFSIKPEALIADLGTVKLDIASKVLEGVTVIQAPITLKQDTVEYNAGSFKVRENASVEDLLRKLPGVQVDRQGNISAQGQTVTRVLVDGKPFFGNDPKLATRNLPSNIVDKVQVIDKKSDQAAFTGIDDGNTEKAINIVIKKDKRKGFFGKASAAYGTDNRYESNISFNRFNNGTQLSVIANANNVNKQGFTIMELMDFGGQGGSGMGRLFGDGGGGGMMSNFSSSRGGGGMGMFGVGGPSGGIISSQATGLNYTDSWSKNLNVNANYFYNNSVTENDRISSRLNFLPGDSNLLNNQRAISNSRFTNHRIYLTAEWKIDSFNSLKFTPSFIVNQNQSTSETISQVSGKINNATRQVFHNISEQPQMAGELLYRRSFRKKGRTFSINFNQQSNNSNGSGDNDFITEFTVPGPLLIRDTTSQIYRQDNDSRTWGSRVAFTEPLSKTRFLELSYRYNNNASNSDRKTWDRNKATGQYSLFNTQLSNVFANSYITNAVGLNIRTVKKTFDYTVGFTAQQASLSSTNRIKDTTIAKTFTNFFPNLMINLKQGRNRQVRINYRGSTRPPSLSQLQPIIDNTNPLYIRQGNPDLKQQFTNNINAFYSKFDFLSFKTFFAFVNLSTVSNKIVNSISYPTIGGSPSGLQVSKPVNANGAFNTAANLSFGFPFKGKKGLLLNTTTSGFYNRDISFINNARNLTHSLVVSQNLSLNYSYKEKYDFVINGGITYNSAKYSIQQAQNDDFFNYVFSVDFSYNFKGGWAFTTDMDMNSYAGRSAGFNQTFYLWNANLSKLLFKKKNGQITLTVYDLLKQNRSINRTVGDGFIEDVDAIVLTQYFTLGFTYNLGRFGGKGANNMMRMPGMRQMRDVRVY